MNQFPVFTRRFTPKEAIRNKRKKEKERTQRICTKNRRLHTYNQQSKSHLWAARCFEWWRKEKEDLKLMIGVHCLFNYTIASMVNEKSFSKYILNTCNRELGWEWQEKWHTPSPVWHQHYRKLTKVQDLCSLLFCTCYDSDSTYF